MFIIHSICERIVWIVTFFITRVFGSFKAVGKENLKNIPTPLMIISNHVSFWDPMTIGTLFPFFSKYLPITFMAADEFFKNPILKAFFWLTNTLPAQKGKGIDVSLKKPREILRNGGVFLTFPQGQRHLEGEPPKPRRGPAFLALEMPELTILPVFIEMSRGWGIIKILLRKKKITLKVGRSFKLAEVSQNQDPTEVAQDLADEIFKLK